MNEFIRSLWLGRLYEIILDERQSYHAFLTTTRNDQEEDSTTVSHPRNFSRTRSSLGTSWTRGRRRRSEPSVSFIQCTISVLSPMLKLPTNRLADLLELRRLKKLRQGIDAAKLSKGDVKKRRKRTREEEEELAGGLRKGTAVDEDE